MLIVESGKVVEVCAEPGEYTYDASTEASIFDGDYAGDLGESFRLLVRQMKERFAFGGDTGKDQRVYYINLKEIVGNKYGTPSEVPFKSYDDTTGLALLMRCAASANTVTASSIQSYFIRTLPAMKATSTNGASRQPAQVGTPDGSAAGFRQGLGPAHRLFPAARSYTGAGSGPERRLVAEMARFTGNRNRIHRYQQRQGQ